MRLSKKVSWTLAGLLILSMLVLFSQRAEASDNEKPQPPRYDDCNGIANCNDIDARGGSGGDGGEGGEANADANTGPIDNSSEGGGANVSTSSEHTSLVLSGARDSADCFTKMGIGAEGFGIFWSRSDPFCKTVRLVASHIDRGNLSAAARLECTLNEWEAIYGHRKPRNKDGTMTDGYSQCVEDLDMTPPEPTGNVVLTGAEYQELVTQAVQQEEYQEHSEQVEYRYTQQQHMIEALEEEHDDDQEEIAALKKRVNDEVAEADARRAAVRAKIAAKEAEVDGSENPDK